MPALPLDASIRRHDSLAIIDLKGEVNGFSETVLQQAYTDAVQTQPDAVLLNFDGVDYINSTGIALIVGLLARARQVHLPLLVSGLSAHYRELFAITRLSDFMTVVADEEDALVSVASVQ